MFKIELLSILFVIMLSFVCPVSAETVNITVSEDAYIDQANPDTNYGNNSHMYSYYTSNGKEQKSLLKFNVPAHTTSAILYVYTDGGWKNNQNTYVTQSSSDWSENTVTWNNPPSSISGAAFSSVIMDKDNQWKSFNVSSIITDSEKSANYSFRLLSSWGYDDRWTSKENESYAPYLVVTTNESSPNEPIDNSSINNKTINITAFEDSYVSNGNPISNYGNLPYVNICNTNSLQEYGYFKFYVPNYTSSMKIHLYNYFNSGTVSVSLVSSDWSENTVTWNTKPSTNYGLVAQVPMIIDDYSWYDFNITTTTMPPGNYTLKIVPQYGYNGRISTKENAEHAPYIEITPTEFTDISYNNKTKDDSKSFTVSKGDTIRFEITAPNATNISYYNWSVNKVNKHVNTSFFNFTVPSFDTNYPYTGIWEIRVEGTYKNDSKVIREWLISGLSESQAPYFIDYFIDQNNTFRSEAIRDPWGRKFPTYYTPSYNLISNGYYTGGNSGSDDENLKSKFDVTYGTIKLKIRNPGVLDMIGFYIYDEDGNWAEMRWTSNEFHDYFSVVGNGTGLGADYYPISRRWIGQAPGVFYWNDAGWHDITIIHTKDEWWSIWDNDSALPAAYLQIPKGYGNASYIKLIANGQLQMDCIQVYKDRYIYPQTEVRYGTYPKWWVPHDYQSMDPVNDKGIIVFGRELTLKQISNTINNDSLMTYNNDTKTAILKTNLFLKSGSELNITNETLLFDTVSGSKFIRPDATTTLRVLNSTISTTGNNPMYWDFASSTAITVNNPDVSATLPNGPSTSRSQPYFDFRGRFIVENSTINNTGNLFMDGPHELRINDTVFSNVSMAEYGSNAEMAGAPCYNMKVAQATGAKSLWIVPRNDLAAYSINNISFVDTKGNVDIKVVGGAWIFNTTTIKNSDLANVNISTKKAWKYTDFQYYNHPWEPSSFSLLNCRLNESNMSVETDMAKIKTKYYTEILVIDTNGNPLSGSSVNISSSNPEYYAENLTEEERATNDGYGPGIGPGEGGVSGYGTESSQYTTYSGGNYFRWWDAQKLGNATTDVNGRTALPSGNTSNSIVLTDYVLTKETGNQSKESIKYNLTVKTPDSKLVYIQDVDPDSTWYRENPLISEYTITAIIPDNSSKGPHIIGFAPSTDNSFNPGEKKNFRVWTDESLTNTEWRVNGSSVLKGSLNYTWIVAEGNTTIEFIGSNANGTVSQVWKLGRSSEEPTQEIKFSPADSVITRNVSEKVDFSVSPDVFTTKMWYVNGYLMQNNTTSMTKCWNAAGTYNVTFSGSGSRESVLHTWTVNVIEEPKEQNESIITIAPEYQIVEPKKPFNLSIKTEPATSITGTQLDFIFNSSMTSVINVTEGDLLKQSGAYTIFSSGTINNSAGTAKNIYGFILGTSNISSPGTMAMVNLTAGNRTGMVKFSLSNVLISDANSKSVPYNVTNATVLIDTAPVINTICCPKSVDEKSTLTFKVSANDADGDRLILSASGLPKGAIFNTTSGNFTWTPERGQAGVYVFTFKVSDGYLSDSENVTVTVNKLNNPPVISSFEPLNGSSFSEGESIRISANASDADGQALNYSIRIDGVTCSTGTEYLWETDYSSSGNHTIEVAVSDGIDEIKGQHTIYISNCLPRWDVDENGIVNILDITSVSQKYGTTVSKPYPRYDVNQDGAVNILDLTLVGNHFGEYVK